MRLFFSLALIGLFTSFSAQEVTYPYNPDANNDQYVAVSDVLSTISTFGSEFLPTEIQIDGINLLQVIQDLQNQIGALQGEMLDVNYVESTFSAMQQEIDDQQQDIEALQTENASLTQQILYLQNAGFLNALNAGLLTVDLAQIDYGHITNLTSTGGTINLGIDDTNNEIKIGTNDSGGAASVARTINIGNDKATVNIVYDTGASLSLNGTVLTSSAADLNTITNSATTGNLVVGTGSGDGTLKSNGDNNLILKTGNSTTGKIEIVDGANGNIMIQPNGTGSVGISKVDIDSGSVDATIIGANTATEAAFTNLTSTGGTINLGIDDTNNEIKIGTNDADASVDIARTITIGNSKATVNIVYDTGASLSLNGTVLTSSAADLNTITNSATTGNLVVGTGSGDGTLKSNGDNNLILKTGNSTTGKIEIVDGANGNIMIQPNGTGKLDVTGILDCEQLNINGTQVLTNQQPAITDLLFGATLPDVILKVNDILALLRTHGLIAN